MGYRDTEAYRLNCVGRGKPIELPPGYDWAEFLRRHGRKIRFRNDGCWEWLGTHDVRGYGLVVLKDRPRRAHRLTWTLLVGRLPDRLTVDHLCRRKACINPDHLELVTARENSKRAPMAERIKAQLARDECIHGHPLGPVVVEAGRRRRSCPTCIRLRREQRAARSTAVPAQPRTPATHCGRGHEYTPENTYWYPDGKERDCIECLKIRRARRDRRQSARNPEPAARL